MEKTIIQEWKIQIKEPIPVGPSGFWSIHVYQKRSGRFCPAAKRFNINKNNHKPNVGMLNQKNICTFWVEVTC